MKGTTSRHLSLTWVTTSINLHQYIVNVLKVLRVGAINLYQLKSTNHQFCPVKPVQANSFKCLKLLNCQVSYENRHIQLTVISVMCGQLI